MDPKVKVKKDSVGYMNDLSLILGALGKHMEVINNIELNDMDKFTLAGLTLAIGTQLQILSDKFVEWGLMKSIK